ncbi:protein of unknown function [Salinibacillus kushneri]|uniref:Uncharacterized protein n=1 Tax=Salinibacillus kushneri TaxID=237682 RepID=A0A1I0DW90_9BACI|nr:DUF4179 domain-containing protein [Salinibacillus kushneri]SET36908.1 protein of unknown function [Salinibacillus kushneri]
MDKWENEIKKMHNEEVPKVVQKRMQETVKSLPERNNMKKWRYLAISAVLSLCIMSGMSYLSPAFAQTLKSIPVIGSVAEYIGDLGMKNGYEKGVGVSLQEESELDNKSEIFTDDFIDSVKFTESYFDGTSIYLGFLLRTEDIDRSQIDKNDLIKNLRFSGITINGTRSGYAGGVKDLQRITENTYAGAFKFNMINNQQVTSPFKLGFHLQDTLIDIKVQQSGEIERYPITVSSENQSLELNFKEVSFTPLMTKISIESITDKTSQQPLPRYHLLVQDEAGRVLKQIDMLHQADGTQLLDNGEKSVYDFHFEPIDEVPQSLTVIPYTRSDNEGEATVHRDSWNGTSLTLSQGPMGNIIIQNVVRKDDNVTIRFKTTGKNPFHQMEYFNIEDNEGNNFEYLTPNRMGKQTFEQTYLDFPKNSKVHFRVTEQDEHRYLTDLKASLPIK